MNALIVYDSQYGNTERIAQAIVEALLMVGDARAIRVETAFSDELEDMDMLILGSPTHNWRPTTAMRALMRGLSAERLHGLKAACFDTRLNQWRWLTGSAADHMAKGLHGKGASLLAPSESFFVLDVAGPLADGEAQRAAKWAMELAKLAGVQSLAAR